MTRDAVPSGAAQDGTGGRVQFPLGRRRTGPAVGRSSPPTESERVRTGGKTQSPQGSSDQNQ